jgi:hypothetical protein
MMKKRFPKKKLVSVVPPKMGASKSIMTHTPHKLHLSEEILEWCLLPGLATSEIDGSLIAFVVIALYYGYDRLTQTIAEKWAGIDASLLASYAALVAIAVVAAALLLGLWDMVAGRSPNTSQRVMRWRVVLQFVAICLAMAALYVSARY